MMKKFKKGFSLVELLVVIAIIGILAAVGITAYSGYTSNAKIKATTSNHSSIVAFLNSEMAKCVSGSGQYAWNEACSVNTPNDGLLVTHFNTTLNLKNPYKTDQGAVEASGTASEQGKTGIACVGTRAGRNMQCTVNTLTKTDVAALADTVKGY